VKGGALKNARELAAGAGSLLEWHPFKEAPMLHAALLSLAVMAAPASTKVKPATNVKDPVCGMTVPAKAPTVVVRGRAYRVCGKECGESLQKHPEKYLEKDGTPKVEKKK
jgi:YHS domain-containing protein